MIMTEVAMPEVAVHFFPHELLLKYMSVIMAPNTTSVPSLPVRGKGVFTLTVQRHLPNKPDILAKFDKNQSQIQVRFNRRLPGIACTGTELSFGNILAKNTKTDFPSDTVA